MSAIPTTTLPQRTRTAVIDLIFRDKYFLSHTQILVMYYLLMLKNWAKKTNNEYYIITSKKIEKDLNLHEKTVEASLTKLAKLNLIDRKRFVVDDWNPNKTYRGIAITPLGKEYNLSHYRENEYQLVAQLKRENEEFRVQNDEIETKNQNLELENKILKLNVQSDEDIKRASIEALEAKKALEEKCLALEIENKKLKEQIEMRDDNKNATKEEKQKKEKDIDNFRKKIIKEYAQSGKPICNGVRNADKWAVNTKFYINSYSRLSIYLPSGESKQIADPKQISNFWEWLFDHQHRVGKLLDEKNLADISVLLPFIGALISFNGKFYNIHRLIPVIGGVKVILSNKNGELMAINNSYGNEIIDVYKCKKWFELYVKK